MMRIMPKLLHGGWVFLDFRSPLAQKPFIAEHAKSGRAPCCRCLTKIVKNRVRVGWRDNGGERWMHAEWYVGETGRRAG
jgi:hypothetical protein